MMFCEIQLGQLLGPNPGQGVQTEYPHADSLPVQRVNDFRRYYGWRDTSARCPTTPKTVQLGRENATPATSSAHPGNLTDAQTNQPDDRRRLVRPGRELHCGRGRMSLELEAIAEEID
jgi:hypothetical protein